MSGRNVSLIFSQVWTGIMHKRRKVRSLKVSWVRLLGNGAESMLSIGVLVQVMATFNGSPEVMVKL